MASVPLTTANHPFWSEDRKEFVRADELKAGERLQAFNGTPMVLAVMPRPGPEPVYNLEVQVEHVYHVTQAGILVHNGAICPKLMQRARELRGRGLSGSTLRKQILKDFKFNLHHPIPKFLGGARKIPKEQYYKIERYLHTEYHRTLHEVLKKKGFPLSGLGGINGSKKKWDLYFKNNPGSQHKAFDAVLEAARIMDKKHGTSFTQFVWQSIINGNYSYH